MTKYAEIPQKNKVKAENKTRYQFMGRVATPKQINFWKSSKRPLTSPPPSFSENHVAFFLNFMFKKPGLNV